MLELESLKLLRDGWFPKIEAMVKTTGHLTKLLELLSSSESGFYSNGEAEALIRKRELHVMQTEWQQMAAGAVGLERAFKRMGDAKGADGKQSVLLSTYSSESLLPSPVLGGDPIAGLSPRSVSSPLHQKALLRQAGSIDGDNWPDLSAVNRKEGADRFKLFAESRENSFGSKSAPSSPREYDSPRPNIFRTASEGGAVYSPEVNDELLAELAKVQRKQADEQCHLSTVNAFLTEAHNFLRLSDSEKYTRLTDEYVMRLSLHPEPGKSQSNRSPMGVLANYFCKAVPDCEYENTAWYIERLDGDCAAEQTAKREAVVNHAVRFKEHLKLYEATANLITTFESFQGRLTQINEIEQKLIQSEGDTLREELDELSNHYIGIKSALTTLQNSRDTAGSGLDALMRLQGEFNAKYGIQIDGLLDALDRDIQALTEAMSEAKQQHPDLEFSEAGTALTSPSGP